VGAETGDVTGTKDKHYNIIWFTEQSLSNALRLESYIQDAERDGDSELADFSAAHRTPAATRQGAVDQAPGQLIAPARAGEHHRPARGRHGQPIRLRGRRQGRRTRRRPREADRDADKARGRRQRPDRLRHDNYGDWDATRDDLLWRALHGEHPELVDPIQPQHEYPSIWKPRHSAFYETALGYLLSSHDIKRVVLTGQVTEQCIHYSALDAYIRHLDVVVPEDAVVAIHPHLAHAALEMVRRNMRGQTPAADDVELYSAPTR
jgi:nicotinamidase-related amidase